ncbi:uncharacterized protein BJX67DRAFT_267404 [Aspergillus lucknowensis]|uniref:Uncharacterized protein n=1 Tax=Aspergillus lucknowensis TaxID=176173 RepID=A0ABR4LFA7_9EURO
MTHRVIFVCHPTFQQTKHSKRPCDWDPKCPPRHVNMEEGVVKARQDFRTFADFTTSRDERQADSQEKQQPNGPKPARHKPLSPLIGLANAHETRHHNFPRVALQCILLIFRKSQRYRSKAKTDTSLEPRDTMTSVRCGIQSGRIRCSFQTCCWNLNWSSIHRHFSGTASRWISFPWFQTRKETSSARLHLKNATFSSLQGFSQNTDFGSSRPCEAGRGLHPHIRIAQRVCLSQDPRARKELSPSPDP